MICYNKLTINAGNGAISLDKDSSVHFNRDKNGVEHKDPNGNTSMHFMEKVSTVAGQYEFADRGDISNRTLNQHEVRATVCDWNKDGIPDLILSPESGNLYYFKNNLVTKN